MKWPELKSNYKPDPSLSYKLGDHWHLQLDPSSNLGINQI